MAKTAKATSGAIGKVAIIYGDVKAISPDGTVRVLGPNSPVFADDQIITGGDGSVSLILDGTPPIHLDLGRMTQITLDEDVYGGPASTADAAAEADKVQQALLAGDQPIEPEAPAAGGEANAGGGHPVVDNSLTGEEVTPDSGAETRGIEFSQLQMIEREAKDTAPEGGDDNGAVDDEGIKTCRIKGNLGGPEDGSDHPTDFAYLSGKLNYNFGNDGPAAVNPFVWSMDGLSGMGITSHGHTLLYEVVDGGTTLNAYYLIGCESPNGEPRSAMTAEGPNQSGYMDGFRVDVFSLELTNAVTGAYTFTLFKPLDHPLADTENDINYVFGYTLKDSDGDTGHGVLRMLVDDDSPVMGWRDEIRTVDEDDINTSLSQGNWPNDGFWHDGSVTGDSDLPWHDWFNPYGPATIWGSLKGVVSFGADGPADYGKGWGWGHDGFSLADDLSGLENQGLHSHGDALSYKVIGDTLFGYVPNITEEPDGNSGNKMSFAVVKVSPVEGRIVFTLELEGNGCYAFRLFDQLDHTYGDNIQGKLPIDLSSAIVATDFDGDSVTLEEGKFVINITDDAPKEAGCWPEIGIVEEEALSGGNQEIKDPWPDTNVATGSLVHQVSVGADEQLKFSFSADLSGLPALTSNGEAVTYRVDGNTLYAEVVEGGIEAFQEGGEQQEPGARIIFTLELQPDGHYIFTLLDQLDHPAHNYEDMITLNLSSVIVATDFDGDSITLHNDFYIKVIDDIPDVSIGGPSSVSEDGAPISGTWNASIGADQPGSVEVAVNGQSYAIGAAIEVLVGSQNVGTLTVNENHTWTFDPNTNLDNQSGKAFTFSIKAVDADGDQIGDCQNIRVLDGTNPSGGGKIQLVLDEEALNNANALGSNPDSTLEQISQTISFTAGSDDLTSFAFSNDVSGLVRNTDGVAGNELTWVRDTDTQITGHFGSGSGPVAITLTLDGPAGGVIPYGTSGNVTVTATLSDNLKHVSGHGENSLSLGMVQVFATDKDGDKATGLVSVAVIDDVPTVSTNATVYLDDETASHTYAAPNLGGTDDYDGVTPPPNTTGTLSHTYGADGAGTTLFSGATLPVSGGFSSAVSDGGKTLTISQMQGTHSVDVLKLTLSDTTSGSYTVEQLNPIFHPKSQVSEENLTFTAQYQVTDGDGDTAQGTLTLNVDDDTPTAANSRQVITLDALSVNDLDAGFVDWHPTGITSENVDAHDTLADQLRWGTAGQSGQSGYNLDDVTAYTTTSGADLTEGQPFKIADFTHINQPISGTELDYTYMSISMDVVINGQSETVTFKAKLDHNETPNPAPDVIELTYQTTTVGISGGSYQVELLGFGTDANHIVNKITTAEGTNTKYGVWAKVTQLEPPSFEGNLDWSPGADGGHIMEIRTSINGQVLSDHTITAEAGDYDLLLQGAYGQLEVQSDTGHYKYTPNAATSGGEEKFSFTVVDGDGDKACADLTILIGNNEPEV